MPYVLRPFRAGDVGWVVHRHGARYAAEYGWDWTFEAVVAEVMARYVRQFDPARENGWIAEREGAAVGSVLVVRGEAPGIAQLRVLLVEPEARGLGIGRRLVEECLHFARERGCARMMLSTISILVAARNIYRAAGFTLRASEPYRAFGHDLVGETWERAL